MLKAFDWIRRCRNGTELLATLALLETRTLKIKPPELAEHKCIGPPLTLFDRPCQRCWVYAPVGEQRPYLCSACLQILAEASHPDWVDKARHGAIIWGAVSDMPRLLASDHDAKIPIFGRFILDAHHFLIVLNRRDLAAWLGELAIYDSQRLTGVLQVFPSVYTHQRTDFASIFTLATAQDYQASYWELRVQLHPRPFYLLADVHRKRRIQRDVTLGEAIQMLEMVRAIRMLFNPEEQATLLMLARKPAGQEWHFYWGRFIRQLTPAARDFIETWQIRQWPAEKLKLLYDLKPYMVDYTS